MGGLPLAFGPRLAHVMHPEHLQPGVGLFGLEGVDDGVQSFRVFLVGWEHRADNVVSGTKVGPSLLALAVGQVLLVGVAGEAVVRPVHVFQQLVLGPDEDLVVGIMPAPLFGQVGPVEIGTPDVFEVRHGP